MTIEEHINHLKRKLSLYIYDSENDYLRDAEILRLLIKIKERDN